VQLVSTIFNLCGPDPPMSRTDRRHAIGRPHFALLYSASRGNKQPHLHLRSRDKYRLSYFSDKQYGFIKGRSTVLQLLKIMDDWTTQLDYGGQIDVIYTDFAKAFDTVPHHRLITNI